MAVNFVSTISVRQPDTEKTLVPGIPDNVPDYYTNENYWQEYDCPTCLQDMDVYPIPRPGTTVRCSCGTEWKAGEHEPNTYFRDALGIATIMQYPEPEKE